MLYPLSYGGTVLAVYRSMKPANRQVGRAREAPERCFCVRKPLLARGKPLTVRKTGHYDWAGFLGPMVVCAFGMAAITPHSIWYLGKGTQ